MTTEKFPLVPIITPAIAGATKLATFPVPFMMPVVGDVHADMAVSLQHPRFRGGPLPSSNEDEPAAPGAAGSSSRRLLGRLPLATS
jgi:hypothetical protein